MVRPQRLDSTVQGNHSWQVVSYKGKISDMDGLDALIVETTRAAIASPHAVYRFGSSVAGAARADSDIDIGLLADRPLDPLARFELQETLAIALRRSVDLVDLRSASTVMASQVVTTGIVIHDGAPQVRGAFEDRVFSAYARLNEERRGILERIAAEGTVHGR